MSERVPLAINAEVRGGGAHRVSDSLKRRGRPKKKAIESGPFLEAMGRIYVHESSGPWAIATGNE